MLFLEDYLVTAVERSDKIYASDEVSPESTFKPEVSEYINCIAYFIYSAFLNIAHIINCSYVT
jgi:hypothetical protein